MHRLLIYPLTPTSQKRIPDEVCFVHSKKSAPLKCRRGVSIALEQYYCCSCKHVPVYLWALVYCMQKTGGGAHRVDAPDDDLMTLPRKMSAVSARHSMATGDVFCPRWKKRGPADGYVERRV